MHCLSIFCADAWPGVRADVAAALSAVLPASKVSSVPPSSASAVLGEMKRYEYPRFSFSNKSLDILALRCAALDRLGIAYRHLG